MSITDGIADREFCMPGPDTDPLGKLRLIAAHNSTDPAVANIEQVVRDALAVLDHTDPPENPLADRFEIERFRGGDCDVKGETVVVSTEDGTDGRMVRISASTEIGWRDLHIPRATAIELRDALDVLVVETRRRSAAKAAAEAPPERFKVGNEPTGFRLCSMTDAVYRGWHYTLASKVASWWVRGEQS